MDGHLVERGEGVGYVRVLLADHRPPAAAVVGRRRLRGQAPVLGGRRPPAWPPVAAEQGAKHTAHAPAVVAAKPVDAAAGRWQQPSNMRGRKS